jgi:hypothetical protein
VNGDLDALNLAPGPCILDRAVGLWQGWPVSYAETFDIRCQRLRETGPFFAF